MTTPAETATTAPPPIPQFRALAPDLARGFMLLLIAIANSVWYLWGHPRGNTSNHPTDGSPLDSVLQAVTIITVDARIYPMFAFLFGYGMVQFTQSRLRRGVPYPQVRRMLRRRHWAMILFGFVHALLLFMGDILGGYGLLGLLMVWIFFDRRDKTLKIWAGVLIGLLAVGTVLSLWSGVFLLQNPELMPAGAQPDGMEAFTPEGLVNMASGQPDYLVALVTRVIMWVVALPVMSLLMLVMPTVVLLSWLAARRGVLDDPAAHRGTLLRNAVVGIALGWAAGVPTALQHVGVLAIPDGVAWMFQLLDVSGGLLTGIGYVSLFALLSIRWTQRRPVVVDAIAAVGKRSLSFYLLQSVIFAPLLSAWGLGLGRHLNTAGAWALSIGIWVLSLVLAHRLEKNGRRGPAEVVLRRLTYGLPPARP